MSCPDKDKWLEAAQVEMRAHLENGAWELVELPSDQRAIGSQEVLRVKRNADGSVEHYKGRQVAQGFSQQPGIDFHEVFAPTTCWQPSGPSLPLLQSRI